MSLVFKRVEDVGSRTFFIISSIADLIAVLIAGVALYRVAGSISLTVILFLAVVAVLVMVVAGLILRIGRLEKGVKSTQEQVDLTKAELVDEISGSIAWELVLASEKFIDDEIIKAIASSKDREECLRQTLQAIQAACVENILPTHIKDEWRSAFLELQYDVTPKPTDKFRVMAERRLTSESLADINTHLSFGRGLAGAALQDRSKSFLYVPDVDAPEAVALGYIATGSVSRHKSIVCSGVWVDDKPVSVFAVDCLHRSVFTEWDLQIIEEIYTDKIRLAYSIFLGLTASPILSPPGQALAHADAPKGRRRRATGEAHPQTEG